MVLALLAPLGYISFMLKIMRSSKFFSVFILGIVTVFITIVFVFWGIGPQQNTSEVIIAQVNKSRITLSEYDRAYELSYRRAREIYKDEAEIEKLNLRQTVLTELIDNRVLMAAAKEAGITITEAELQEAIMNEPAFHKEGVFDKDVYRRRLRLNRLTPAAFESGLSKDLLRNKMRMLIAETAELTSEEMKTLDSIKGDKTQLREIFMSSKRAMTVKAYIESLKRRMKIIINREYTS